MLLFETPYVQRNICLLICLVFIHVSIFKLVSVIFIATEFLHVSEIFLSDSFLSKQQIVLIKVLHFTEIMFHLIY